MNDSSEQWLGHITTGFQNRGSPWNMVTHNSFGSCYVFVYFLILSGVFGLTSRRKIESVQKCAIDWFNDNQNHLYCSKNVYV